MKPPTDEAAEQEAKWLEKIIEAMGAHPRFKAHLTEREQMFVAKQVLRVVNEAYRDGYQDGQFDAARYRID